ncbi:hypothetical protein OF846_004499 [Rhodotorula toruloides]|nr:hypothetical protein OF846_004499 [Rhodotorula toruloides]
MSAVTQTKALLPTWLRSLLPAESTGELSGKTVGHFQHYKRWKAAVFAVFDHDEYWYSLSDTSSSVVQAELRAIRSHIEEDGKRVYAAVIRSKTRSVSEYYTLLTRVVLGDDEFDRVMAGTVDVGNRTPALGEAYGQILLAQASEASLSCSLL